MAWRSTPNVPEHAPERQIHVQEDRSLFDVQFEVGSRILQFLPAVFYAFEIDADCFQGIRQANAVFILKLARLVHIQIAGAGG